MDSFRNLAKSAGFDYFTQGDDHDQGEKSVMDKGEPRADELELGMNAEVRLFHSLNRFVALCNKRGKAQSVGDLSDIDARAVVLLRTKLLDFLRCRQADSILQATGNDDDSLRSVLNHWWITLVNSLRVDTFTAQRAPFPIELVRAIFESLYRIMSMLMILPRHPYKELKVYAQNLLTTVRFCTHRLIFNTKRYRGKLSSDEFGYLQAYDSTLQDVLGQLNAYSFIYLPDHMEFDLQLVTLVVGKGRRFRVDNSEGALFPWKKRCIVSTRRPHACRFAEHQDTKLFKVLLSYLKKDSIFLQFYFHYWHVILSFIHSGAVHVSFDRPAQLALVPGAKIIMEYCITESLQVDLHKISSTKSGSLSSSRVDATMPESAALRSKFSHTAAGSTCGRNLRVGLIWRMLHRVQSVLPWDCAEDTNFSSLVLVHDRVQLRTLRRTPAYHAATARAVFEDLFSGMVRCFPRGIDWSAWCSALVVQLRTLRYENCVVALTTLFNNWTHIPERHAVQVVRDVMELSGMIVHGFSELVVVLYVKLIVFKFSTVQDRESLQLVHRTLQGHHGRMQFLKSVCPGTRDSSDGSPLIFHGGKKFVLSSKPGTRTVFGGVAAVSPGPLDRGLATQIPEESVACADARWVEDTGVMFKVMFAGGASGKAFVRRIELYNRSWGVVSGAEDQGRAQSALSEKYLPSVSRPLDLSLFTAGADDRALAVHDDEDTSITPRSVTELAQLQRLMEVYHLTMAEYSDYTNMLNNEYITIEYIV
ncbi:Ahk1p KNAG_0D04440 [Huiozyma naganishii CBS 8797]|uniref:Uncharacterized protein n=1 Tax=Huiozyma naganishii (strain ATCC MYA-139 / BCRC 22969 / CBS 8797 / KCTC 17520 / NBRC 10181 / NCYC 3082 / Yp74L-3) TaxID=1071383 RepID=J7S638_HUIN7|nr:hypothetical protein KNAG_0D04440 [Kazachstania naganishii CBS 8797]CCK70189.1 hypothetical protein KNAG_0D04440 [Kazachstania naganishii CBS 8797]